MAEKVQLRRVEDSDREFLCAVYTSTRQEELAQTNWDDALKSAFLRMQFDAQDHHYRTHYAADEFNVILVDGRTAGRLYVGRWPGEIRIIDIALLPEFRNRGIGGTLLRDIQREGRRSSRPVTIHVEKMNPALALYLRIGFVVTEDKGVYWLMRWDPAHVPR